MQWGDTPLHWASWRGCTEAIVALINAKASVDAKNKVMPRAWRVVEGGYAATLGKGEEGGSEGGSRCEGGRGFEGDRELRVGYTSVE